MKTQNNLKKELQKKANPQKAKIYQRFFKTGPGEYGERDIFLGVTVPEQRKIAKDYSHLALGELQKLLQSKIHEHRTSVLMILCRQYEKADQADKKAIVDFYLKNLKHINNWDLVDGSAGAILGDYLLLRDKKILEKFARSKNLWKRRIAIIATYRFIKEHQFNWTVKIAKILLKDEYDLIHKAVGWMLREMGKRSFKDLKDFLGSYHKIMPRTMLRYAIEKLPERERKRYLAR